VSIIDTFFKKSSRSHSPPVAGSLKLHFQRNVSNSRVDIGTNFLSETTLEEVALGVRRVQQIVIWDDCFWQLLVGICTVTTLIAMVYWKAYIVWLQDIAGLKLSHMGSVTLNNKDFLAFLSRHTENGSVAYTVIIQTVMEKLIIIYTLWSMRTQCRKKNNSIRQTRVW
jgi:hypothetical protein